MGLFSKLKQKHNHKKSQKAWIKVRNIIKYQDHYVITLSTQEGYDEFFRKMKDSHLAYSINDTGKGLVVISIEKEDSFTIGQLLY